MGTPGEFEAISAQISAKECGMQPLQGTANEESRSKSSSSLTPVGTVVANAAYATSVQRRMENHCIKGSNDIFSNARGQSTVAPIKEPSHKKPRRSLSRSKSFEGVHSTRQPDTSANEVKPNL